MNIDEINPYLLQCSHIGFMHYSKDEYAPYPSRVTKWHEMDIITYGHGYDVVSGTKYEVETGDVFYRTPGLTNMHHRPYYCFFFVFDPIYSRARIPEYENGDTVGDYNEMILTQPQETIPPFDFAKSPKLGKLRDIEPVFRIAMRLDRAWQKPEKDRLLIKALFLQLIGEIREQLTRPADIIQVPGKYQQYARQVEKLTDSIRRNPNEHYSLQFMADQLKLSINSFSSVFSAITGYTPIAFVHQVKLNQIKCLLLDTELSISEIAKECNIEANYLYVFFRKEMNMTPMEYRRQNCLMKAEEE